MKERVDEFYAVRGISICGIVLLHVTAFFLFPGNENHRVYDISLLLNQFVRVFLPLFIVITGFGLAYNYIPDKTFARLPFLKRRVSALLLPYVVWSFLYFLFYLLVLEQVPVGVKIRPLDSADFSIASLIWTFTGNLLFGWNYVHLYYIILLFQFYLLYALLIEKVANISYAKQKLLLTTNLVLYLVLVIYLSDYRHLTGVMFIDLFVRYYWELFISWYIYFLLGVLIGLNFKAFLNLLKKHSVKTVLIYLTTLMVVFVETLYFNENGVSSLTSLRVTVFLNTVPAIPFYFLLGRFLKKSAGKIFSRVKKIGELSFGIYLVHPMLIVVASSLMHKAFPEIFGFGRLLFLVALLAVTLVGSLVFVNAAGRLPVVGFALTGLKRR